MPRSTSVETDFNALIERPARGDPQAFGEIYEQPALRAFRPASSPPGEPAAAAESVGMPAEPRRAVRTAAVDRRKRIGDAEPSPAR